MSLEAADFIALNERLNKLLQRHAVLTAQEEEKAKRSEVIRQALIKAGVNPDEPEKEIARLEAAAKKLLDEATKAVEQFESELTNPAVAQPGPEAMPVAPEPTKEEPKTKPAEAEPSMPIDDSEDIDI
jgi:hypothetical protein